jgi:hypothetical protein
MGDKMKNTRVYRLLMAAIKLELGLEFVIVLTYLLVLAAIEYPHTAHAKDLTSRLGVGYSDSFAIKPLPSIAVKYYPSTDIAVSAALGIDTNSSDTNQSGNSNFGFGAKLYKTIFTEDNLNFYMGAGASLLSSSPASGTGGTTSSGFELGGFVGGEFFIPGLDSLGFNFMAGVGVTSLSSGVRFRTIGETPLSAGIYFYF